MLNCSVLLSVKNLAVTPHDIIIVVPPEVLVRDGFPDWLKRWPNLYIISQPDIEPPPGVHAPVRESSYMRICSWRITDQFNIIRSLNYKYLLQIDDDTFVYNKLNTSIVSDMQNNGSKKLMGGYCRCAGYSSLRFSMRARVMVQPIGFCWALPVLLYPHRCNVVCQCRHCFNEFWGFARAGPELARPCLSQRRSDAAAGHL